MQLLRHFMDGLCAVPCLCSDASFLAFLSSQSDKEFGAAKQQTAKLTLNEDFTEGASAWKAAVSENSLPSNWDRVIYDFKRQLDDIERGLKPLKRATDGLIEGTNTASKSLHRFSEAMQDHMTHEADFKDQSK